MKCNKNTVKSSVTFILATKCCSNQGRTRWGGGGTTVPLEKTIFTIFRISLLISYSLNIRDFSRHIGLTAPWLKNPAYGPGSNCNVLVYYDIISDEQEIERSSYLFTYASLAVPVNQINVFVIVTSPDNIVTAILITSFYTYNF
jgi:hypothetical protein